MNRPVFPSPDEYLREEENAFEKHEYVGGFIFEVPPRNNGHNSIALAAICALAEPLKNTPFEPFDSNTKVRIELPGHTRFYYPDGMVVCDPNPDLDHFQDRPVVLIEVLSEFTRRVDLTEKRDAYLTLPSLRVYAILEPDKPEALVHRREPDGGFQAEKYVGNDAVIALPEISAELALAAVYA